MSTLGVTQLNFFSRGTFKQFLLPPGNNADMFNDISHNHYILMSNIYGIYGYLVINPK